MLEVIDHHRINDFSTSQPVAFRNEIVGSTATIVATIFRENQIPIPPALAGLLLGAVLSDTMDFHSPTTTDRDIQTANILAAIADLDIDTFAEEMFRITSNQEKMSFSDMLNQDLKIYDLFSCKLSISQVIVPSAKETRTDSREILAALDRFAQKSGSILLFSSLRAFWKRIRHLCRRQPCTVGRRSLSKCRWRGPFLPGKPAFQKAADPAGTDRCDHGVYRRVKHSGICTLLLLADTWQS